MACVILAMRSYILFPVSIREHERFALSAVMHGVESAERSAGRRSWIDALGAGC
jgi:hypothetical protein